MKHSYIPRKVAGVLVQLLAATMAVNALSTLPILDYGHSQSLSFANSAGAGQVFGIQVDELTFAITVQIQDAEGDFDIYLRKDGELVTSSVTTAWNESLRISRLDSRNLVNGLYTLELRLKQANLNGDRLRCTLDLEQRRLDKATPLAFDKELGLPLEPANGFAQIFSVEVAPKAGDLRIDAWGADADVDIYARWNSPFANPDNADLSSATYRSRESILVPLPTTVRGAKPSKLYILVVCKADYILHQSRLLVSRGLAVPGVLAPIFPIEAYQLPATTPVMSLAAAATVEIIGSDGAGSGCVISPDGFVLTCRHVIERADGGLSKSISIGFSTDPAFPPDSQFLAELVREDKTQDVALLKIVSGFYGQKLPPNFRFPSLTLANEPSRSVPALGSTLYAVGYPRIGGLGDRPLLTVSKGIVSGLQRRAGALFIKSDVLMGVGGSGGAALDEAGRLVAIPSDIVFENGAQITWMRALVDVPESWWKELSQ